MSQESDLCPSDVIEEIYVEVPEAISIMEHPLNDVFDPFILYDEHGATSECPPTKEWTESGFVFEVKVDTSGTDRKLYHFSSKLNKLYLDLGNIVPVSIKWEGATDLRLRSQMIYSNVDSFKTPVTRCRAHRDKDDATNNDYAHIEHVLATDNENARYCINQYSKRCSVVVPLSLQKGYDHATIYYKFMCKTTCTGGINRKPTDVLFTLEDQFGTVYGRRKFGVKICSCPRRDMAKEERGMADFIAVPHGKRIKIKKEAMEPPAKRAKETNSATNVPVTFMVTAVNAEAANIGKNLLQNFSDSYMLLQSSEGKPGAPLFIFNES